MYLSYPAPIEEANLIMLNKYRKDFKVEVGLSDHTKGFLVLGSVRYL